MRIHRKSIVLALSVMVLGMATMSSLFSLVAYAIMNPTITITISKKSEASAVEKWVDNVNAELVDTELDSKILSERTQDSSVREFQFLEIEKGSSSSKSESKELTLTIRKTGQKQPGSNTYVAGYDDINTQSKNTVMTVALSTLESSNNISRTTKVKLYNFLYNSDETTASMVKQLSTDTRADFYKGYSFLKDLGIFGFVSKVLGIISIVVFALLAITLTLDLSYINIPFIQYIFDTKELGKNKRTLCDRLISYEAREAVKKNSESGDSNGKMGIGSSAVGLYLPTKAKQMSVLFICLLYLVSGKIYVLLAQFMDMIGEAVGI